MRIAHVSRLRSANELTGTPRAGLARRLAEIRGVELVHIILASATTFETLIQRKKLARIGGWLLQTDAMINVVPVELPSNAQIMRAERSTSRKFLRSLEERCSGFFADWHPDVVHVWGGGEDWQSCALRLGEECNAITAQTYDALDRSSRSRRANLRSTSELADIIFATSQSVTAELKHSAIDPIGPFFDSDFWSPSRVSAADLQFWDRLVGPRRAQDPLFVYIAERLDQAFTRSLFRAIGLLRDASSTRSIRLVYIVDADVEETRRHVHQLAERQGVRDRITIVGTQPRALIRALYKMSLAVVFGASCSPARWNVLEPMSIGCVPFAPKSSVIAEPVSHGANGFTYRRTSVRELAEPLRECVERPERRAALQQHGQATAKAIDVGLIAHKCLARYKSVTRANAGKNQSVRTSIPVFRKRNTDWIRNTVLALDLDLTLLRPSPLRDLPTAFPLQSSGAAHIEHDLGSSYVIRSGLEALHNILQLPWKAKIVCSMADQDKVDQATRSIRIGNGTLASYMDACVGSEILKAFAESRGVSLESRRVRSLNNPHARLIRSKPSQFLKLENLHLIGRALAAGNREEAERIAATSPLKDGYGLFIDDNPYLEPALPEIACYRVLPFIDIEDFELICRKTDLNSPLIFNFIDHVWRISNAPFHFLAYLLEQRPDWNDFVQHLNTENTITECVRYADTFRQFSWMRTRAFGCSTYRRFLQTRADSDKQLDLARYREHARIYHALARDHISKDVENDWAVLLLGRDMEYAYHFLAHSYPDLVASRKVALLPLSRSAVERTSEEALAQILCEYLPCIPSPQTRGIRIYDVGFHGRIPAHISRVMQRFAWTLTKSVEAALLTCCNCPDKPSDTCMGSPVRFQSLHGPFSVSRNFGISIERCPHRTGPVEHIEVSGGVSAVQFAPQKRSDKQRAIALETLIGGEAMSFCRPLPERPHPVGYMANEALQTLLNTAPYELQRLRRNATALSQIGHLLPSGSVRVAVFPFCGTDLLTPLVCFPRLERVILIDTYPAVLDWTNCNFAQASVYLIEWMRILASSASQYGEQLAQIKALRNQRLYAMETAHMRALVSAASFLSFARLLPASEAKLGDVQLELPNTNLSLAWSMKFDDGRILRLEYLRATSNLCDPWLRAAMRRVLLKSPSALILRRLASVSSLAEAGLLEWSKAASLTLHDQTAAFFDSAKHCDSKSEHDSPVLASVALPHGTDLSHHADRIYLRAGLTSNLALEGNVMPNSHYAASAQAV